MKKIYTLVMLLASLMSVVAMAAPAGVPAITFHSSAHSVIGEDNLFSFLIGASVPGTYVISDGLGEREVEFGTVSVDPSTGDYIGEWIKYKAPADGDIKIYGDPSVIDVIVADGAYITSLDMSGCTNLEILSLEHNALERLDLTPFKNLMAIYLSDNPFTETTPLKIGAPKNNLQILEIDIIDHLDQSFNLSDYPALVAFDGYHNMDLRNVDPTGCPDLAVLSLEMAPVETLDVSQNTNLLRLNISESRITHIDLSHNTKLEHFLGSHDSGSVNTEYKLQNVDLTNNPNLKILNLNGNHMGSVDLSHNTKLTNLSLSRNSLTSLDLSANRELYSVYIMDNDLDFATLPLPEQTWGEYFYRQNPMPVSRSVEEGATIDLSHRVLRAGTQTIARVWKQRLDGEAEALDESLYSYADGKISFPQAMTDSVYVEFANNAFVDYTLTTTPFMVKTPEEFGKPSRIAAFTPAQSGAVVFSAGLYGAASGSPKVFYVDFGDGVLKEFTSESALEAENNVTGIPSGQVAIYIPEGEVLTSLYIDGYALSSVDLTSATELGRLTLRDCGLYEIDLRYNRCLTDLDLSGNQLQSLDLQGIYGDYEKNVLSSINASRNRISSFNNIATRATVNLDLSDNLLEEISLKNYDNVRTLDLSGNRLTDIDLEYLSLATDVDLSGNSLVSVKTCPTAVTENIDVSLNNLAFATLPLPAELGSGYIYAPQKDIAIAAKAPVVNLSAYNAVVAGNPTSFTWKKTDGTVLADGTDYTVKSGITTFLRDDLGEVYCELSNAAFPMLSGVNVLRTTKTVVIGSPTHVVASFRTMSGNGSPQVIFAATEPVQLYIDWNGDGSELVGYDVQQTYRTFDVSSLVPGALVTIYASDQDVASKVNVFSIYDIKLKDVDLSPLTGVYAISLGKTGLTSDDIIMPVSPGLGELTLPDNSFESFPYAQAFPNISSLDMSGNLLTSFDASELDNLAYLVLSRNNITDLTFDNPSLWSVMADNNRISSLDLSGLPSLGQILLNSNDLSEIDLTPVKNTLYGLSLVDNRFTFATLPIASSYPHLNVYYYGNQAPLDVKCQNMTVDLSSQVSVDGTATQYAWYLGVPEYNPETGMIEGDLLSEGTDYEIENGVTRFLREQNGKILCVMTNSIFPNLTLITDLIALDPSGVEEMAYDSDEYVKVYTLQGVLVSEGAFKDALNGLASGIYVAGGRKIIVK